MNDQTTTTGTASPLKRSVLKGKARASLLGHYMPPPAPFFSRYFTVYYHGSPPIDPQVHPPFGTIFVLCRHLCHQCFGIFQVGITGLFLSNACHQPVLCGRHFLWLLA